MTELMPIAAIPDWEMRIRRADAFWSNAILDRPYAWITCPRPGGPPVPPLSLARHWSDPEYVAAHALAAVESTEFHGDALPMAFPNIGPDLFPVLYGGELAFEDTTSFIGHFLADWAQAGRLAPDFSTVYARAIDRMYDALLAAGREHFYVGWPDLHGGGDCLAAWRGPETLCLDLYDHPGEVKRALAKVTGEFLAAYDRYADRLQAAGQAVTGWPRIVSSRRWHVPSNDFSYMIGPAEFREFFLEGLRRECDHYEASLYHLDGVGSLNHLDALLEIDSLNAVQWIQGGGHGDARDWIAVYRKIQQAGKGLQIIAKLTDLDDLTANLRPEGVQLILHLPDAETAEAVLRRIERWL